jgi:hypothetical protein
LGIFRRHEPTGTELNVRLTLDADKDDAPETPRETCWFCGAELEVDERNLTGEIAELSIDPLGPGDSLTGYCHRKCAERARGSLSPQA